MHDIQDIKDIKNINSINVNRPEIGIILGSGLGLLAEDIENQTTIPYKSIPHFPVSTVEGHKGQLILGALSGKHVVCMQGRFHFYEGYSIHEVVYPIRVLQKLGITKLIVTNSAGGINTSFSPGDLMLIEDHINLMGVNPLISMNSESFGPRFPDMTKAYDPEHMEKAEKAAKRLSIRLRKGVYAAMTGPSYETPAEIRYLRAIGADAVGMSTVPEVIAANHGGISVLGISCITNMAAGVLNKPLSHRDVVQVANRATSDFVKLIKEIIIKL
ncbi:MAG TPA: purine-nucleoside phosphorylase [Clostridiales bacterium]|nr:purine-nucleoside phosphorylase [Clostridiales bacterium]